MVRSMVLLSAVNASAWSKLSLRGRERRCSGVRGSSRKMPGHLRVKMDDGVIKGKSSAESIDGDKQEPHNDRER